MFVMKVKIGMLDSGIGGVTVLKKCIRINPNFQYYYYSDSKHNPYGDRSKDLIINYCEKITEFLIENGCCIIIIACNTASAMAVDYLRGKYKGIYFIAIEPAIKLAYDTSTEGTLIMATKGTMDSEKFHQLYYKYHYDNFYLLSCVGLANLIEDGSVDEIRNYLFDNLSVYKGKVSNVVLGCTHYPIIKQYIREVLGNVKFYDGALGVAKRLHQIIVDNNYVGGGYKIYFVDSLNDKEKRKRFFQILEGGIDE